MQTVNLEESAGRSYPARRITKNLVGGTSPLTAEHFCMGVAVLDPNGGQVPWHNHDQEEIYVILEGEGEMCVDDERRTVKAGEAVYIPSRAYHQLSNTTDRPLKMLYCYAPSGDVAHWRQELAGTLPRAGVEAPPLPDGAAPQHTKV